MRLYRLEGRDAVAIEERGMAGYITHMEVMEELWRTGRARVALTSLRDCQVSTVFLGIDSAMPGEAPEVFETQVHGGTYHLLTLRYSTWAGAAAGHWALVARLKALRGERRAYLKLRLFARRRARKR